MNQWPKSISAVTLFVEDLDDARAFYQRAFGLPVHFADDESVVFKFGGVFVNLLTNAAVPELIEPAVMAPADAGARLQLTVPVDDVDAVCAALVEEGIRILNGPMDRPWGVRTASFVDRDGHVWELAS